MIIGGKKYGLEKTDRATKTSLFDRNWVTSLKPRQMKSPTSPGLVSPACVHETNLHILFSSLMNIA
jgi:hypothetical protein